MIWFQSQWKEYLYVYRKELTANTVDSEHDSYLKIIIIFFWKILKFCGIFFYVNKRYYVGTTDFLNKNYW